MNQDNDEHPSFGTTRAPTPQPTSDLFGAGKIEMPCSSASNCRRLTTGKYSPISRIHRHCCCHPRHEREVNLSSAKRKPTNFCCNRRKWWAIFLRHTEFPVHHPFSPRIPSFSSFHSELNVVLSDWGLVVSVASIFNRCIRLHLTLFGFLGESSTCTTLPLCHCSGKSLSFKWVLFLAATAIAYIAAFVWKRFNRLKCSTHGDILHIILLYECDPGMCLVGPLYSSSKCRLHFL